MKRILVIALLFCSTAYGQQFPGVVRPSMGPSDAMNDGRESLARIPWASAEDIKRSPFGVSTGKDGLVPVGEFPTARNQIVQNYQGTGILTKAGDGRIIDCISRHNYVGARLGSSDSEICGCRLYNNRDVCLWIARDAGNCQSTQNHCYGGRIACYNEGGAWFRAVNDTYADALIGHLTNAQEQLTNVLFQHNTVRDDVIRGGNCQRMGCMYNVQREAKEQSTFNVPGLPSYTGKAGIQIDGGGAVIRDCPIVLSDWIHPANTSSGKAATGIVVNADACTIDTSLVDGDGLDGTVGIRVTGKRRDLVVICNARGFQQPNDRLLVVDDAAHTTGLDITFRINGAVKPIEGYIKTGADWTGSIKLIDTANGKTMVLSQGKATK